MPRTCLAVVMVLAVSVAPRAASTVVPAAFREVVTGASLIVRGRVTGLRVVRPPGLETSTVATVAVDRVLKGAPVAFVSVLVPGGDLGRTRTVMVGAPRLNVGDAAVFFLARGPDGVWRPVGLSMGVYRVQPGRAGTPVVHAPVLLDRTTSVGAVVRGDPRRTALSVAAFESLVGVALAPPAPGRTRRAVPR
jgi:hypothetical protein